MDAGQSNRIWQRLTTSEPDADSNLDRKAIESRVAARRPRIGKVIPTGRDVEPEPVVELEGRTQPRLRREVEPGPFFWKRRPEPGESDPDVGEERPGFTMEEMPVLSADWQVSAAVYTKSRKACVVDRSVCTAAATLAVLAVLCSRSAAST